MDTQINASQAIVAGNPEREVSDFQKYIEYLMRLGHRNAPKSHVRPPFMGKNLKRTYFRANVRLINNLTKAALPDKVVNKVSELFSGTKNDRRQMVETRARSTFHSGAYVIAFLNQKRLMINPNQGDHLSKDDLVVYDVHPEDQTNLLTKLSTIHINIECMVRYQHLESGICFYWLFNWNQGSNTTTLEFPSQGIGYVPIRDQFNQAIYSKGPGFIKQRVIAQSTDPNYNSQIKSESLEVLHKSIREAKPDDLDYDLISRQIEAQSLEGLPEGEQIFINAIQKLLQLVNDSLLMHPEHQDIKHLITQNVFCHWDSQSGLSKWVNLFESLCEVAALMLELNVIDHNQSIDTVVTNLIDPNQQFKGLMKASVYPYSMTGLFELMKAQFVGPNPPKRVVSTAQGYFENSKIVKCLRQTPQGKNCTFDEVSSVMDINGDVDIVCVEAHPHNPAKEELFPQDIGRQINRLLEENETLTVIIDTTMDYFKDPVFTQMLEHLGEPIRENRLKLFMYQSCAKLLQMGTDIFPGGLLIEFGQPSLPDQNPDLKITKLERYLSWFLMTFKDETADYCQVIRKNNCLMKKHLQIGLSQESMQLLPNTDIKAAYFTIQLQSPGFNDPGYCKMIEENISRRSKVDRRLSFGFSMTNINDVVLDNLTHLRMSCGVESEQDIKDIATSITDLSHLLSTIKHLVPNADASFKLYSDWVSLLFLRDDFLLQRGVYIQLEVDPGTSESISIPAHLEMTRSILTLEFYEEDMGQNSKRILRQKLSMSITYDEAILLYLQDVYQRERPPEIRVVGDWIYVDIWDDEKLSFQNDGDFKQHQPFDEVQVDVENHTNLIKMTWQEHQYESNKIFVQQQQSGDLWIPMMGLSQRERERWISNLKQHVFHVEPKNEDEIKIELTYCRSDRVGKVKTFPWLSIHGFHKFIEDRSCLEGLSTNMSDIQFEDAVNHRLSNWTWKAGEVLGVDQFQPRAILVLDGFVLQYLYSYTNNLHNDFRQLLQETQQPNLSCQQFSKWLQDFHTKAKSGKKWMAYKLKQQIQYIQHQITSQDIFDPQFRKHIFMLFKSTVSYDARLQPTFNLIVDRCANYLAQKLQGRFTTWIVLTINLLFSDCLGESASGIIIDAIADHPNKRELFSLNDSIADLVSDPDYSEMLDDEDRYIIIKNEYSKERFRDFLENVGLIEDLPEPPSIWRTIANIPN